MLSVAIEPIKYCKAEYCFAECSYAGVFWYLSKAMLEEKASVFRKSLVMCILDKEIPNPESIEIYLQISHIDTRL